MNRRRTRDNSLGDGAYFAADEYVGLFRRLLIQVVDTVVLLLAGVTLGIGWLIVANSLNGAYLLTLLAIIWVYLSVLKPSKIRTAGLRLAGARVVTLQGNQASIIRMTWRLFLWMFGPFNVIYDLIWMGADNDRRTLRDCFAGTCVVNIDAQPLGTGEIHLVRYNALGFNLAYPRVCRPEKAER